MVESEKPVSETTEDISRENLPDVVERAKLGSPNDQNLLAAHLTPKFVRYYSSRVPGEAEDFTQESLVKIIEKLKTFDPSWGKGSYAQNFHGWVYTIARNVLVDHSRRQKQEVRLDKEFEASQLPTEGVPEDLVSPDDFVKKLKLWTNDNIKSEQKSRVVEHALAGLKNSEISGLTGIDERVVKVQLHRARKQLEEEFLYPLGLKRVSNYQINKLFHASRQEGMPAIKILHLWYTTDEMVKGYLSKHPQKPSNANKETSGMIPVRQGTTLQEYALLITKFRHLLTKIDGSFRISLENLEYVRKLHRKARPRRIQAPPGLESLANFAPTHTSYERLQKAALSGKLKAVRDGRWWFTTQESVEEFLNSRKQL